MSQVTKAFSDWWIGSLKSLPWKLTDLEAMGVYIGLTTLFGLFLAASGFITPFASELSTDGVTDRMARAICSS